MNMLFRMMVLAQEAVPEVAPEQGCGGGFGGGAPAGEGAEGAAGACGAMSPLWMVVFFIAMMYFLLIRPQKKQQQKQQQMLEALKKGDRVVTSGGMIGTIRSIVGSVVTLEVGDKVAIQVKKEHIAGLFIEAIPQEKK
jgi:preprotein translocase subunit YajC